MADLDLLAAHDELALLLDRNAQAVAATCSGRWAIYTALRRAVTRGPP